MPDSQPFKEIDSERLLKRFKTLNKILADFGFQFKKLKSKISVLLIGSYTRRANQIERRKAGFR